MILQGHELKLESTGDDVQLHAELAQIQVAIPDAERAKAVFGVGTRDAVAQLQKEHDEQIGGVEAWGSDVADAVSDRSGWRTRRISNPEWGSARAVEVESRRGQR
jgi:hypothetical protein